MDHLRVLLVPFQLTSLILVAVFSVLLTISEAAGFYGIFAQLFLQIWVVKYGYVIIEHIADGEDEAPVMDADMLSPFETRPWVQLAIVGAGMFACMAIGGRGAWYLGGFLLLLLPASMAVLGVGEDAYQAVNPVMLWRLIRGLGVYYLAILASIPLYLGLLSLLERANAWSLVWHATALFCELSFFSLIGGCLYLRRHRLGLEPRKSPERSAARAEGERMKVRDRMLDEVFQQVRLGKHIEATRPLAQWMGDLDGETAARDARYVASRALEWESTNGLNTIGSCLIRHLLRAGRPDAALQIFERLRERFPALTLDSADDLRTLAEFAEGSGREELAISMRLETPIIRP